jgi:hypothetical protein
MISWFRRKLGQAPTDTPAPTEDAKANRGGLFSTHNNDSLRSSALAERTSKLHGVWNDYLAAHIPTPLAADGTMDDLDAENFGAIKSAFRIAQPNMSDALFQWYGTQSFIGHQACAILSQHWMINKICVVPARDAIRNWFEIISQDDKGDINPDVLMAYKKLDKSFKLKQHLLNYVYKGRTFGIRVVRPIVNSPDPDYYEKPFNPDGILPGSFKGWVQIDPYWMSPVLSAEAAGRPDEPGFYEPTWWQINGKLYHRSHLCVFRTEQPMDLLKPSYLYSGVPIPQRIMERVYAAERTGNEAPLLMLTKRLTTYQVSDIAAVMADKAKFDENMQFFTETRDNFAIRVMGETDQMQQFDTSLADVGNVIEMEYKLACAAGDAPVNKIMGTSVGGLSSEGGYDQDSYNETLESIQEHDLSHFVERHHLLIRKSYIEPKFGSEGTVETAHVWNPVDSPSAKERAEINEINARADLSLIQTGAISDSEVNTRLRNDKHSNYSTIRPIDEGEREPVGGDNGTQPNQGNRETGNMGSAVQAGTPDGQAPDDRGANRD